MERDFVAFVNDENKVELGIQEADGNVSSRVFDDAKSIETFAKENADLPNEVKQDLMDKIAAMEQSSRSPVVGSSEARYLIAARHAELDNTIAAGKRPDAAHYADMAKKDVADFAKLDARGRDAVRPDIEKAASLSPEYAAAVKGIEMTAPSKSESVLEKELEEKRKLLAENYVAPLSKPKNGFEVERSGMELERGAFVKPVVIAKDYDEVGLEFHHKKSKLHFRVSENGNSLHTNTPDKKIVADMVALARAKQWSNLKLTGSKDFRQAAWLEAESLGIKTSGYTPTKEDKAQLVTLSAQRQVNSIVKVEGQEKIAPRTDSKVSESILQSSSMLNHSAHYAALSSQDAFKGRSENDLNKLAELRSMFVEDMKQDGLPKEKQDEALTRFDNHYAVPRNLETLQKESDKLHELKLPERKTQEQGQTL